MYIHVITIWHFETKKNTKKKIRGKLEIKVIPVAKDVYKVPMQREILQKFITKSQKKIEYYEEQF